MKLHYIGIFKNESRPAHELVSEKKLDDYSRWTRNSYGEFMTLFSKTVAERTKPGQRLDVEEQDLTFHAFGRSEGIAGIIISDHEYPSRAAHMLLSKVVDEFLAKHPRSSWANSNPTLSFPELNQYIVNYVKPEQIDALAAIQQDLEMTKAIMHDTIAKLLGRGEALEDLVAKSDGLSAQSKMFYKQAQKQNSCCGVM